MHPIDLGPVHPVDQEHRLTPSELGNMSIQSSDVDFLKGNIGNPYQSIIMVLHRILARISHISLKNQVDSE